MKLGNISLNQFSNLHVNYLNNLKNLKGNVFIEHAKVYNVKLNKFESKNLFINNGCYYENPLISDTFFKSVETNPSLEVINLKDNFITPNLFEQHVHGAFGIDFNTNNEREIRDLLVRTKRNGIGAMLATLTPDSIDKLNSQIDIINNIIDYPNSNETRILGINLEGPFFSPKKSGIHLPEILLTPTVENLKKINLKNVKMVTIAPELDKNYEAIKYLNSIGIVPSAGHCMASAEEVRNSKVKCITHLFNAMPGFHHRIPTIVNEGLQNDDIYIEVNTAFELLEPKTIDMIYKLKPKDKIILISDSLKGAKDNENYFYMGGKKIIIDQNNIAKDSDGILAGSIKLLGEIAGKIIDSTKVTFEDFIKFTAINPLNLIIKII